MKDKYEIKVGDRVRHRSQNQYIIGTVEVIGISGVRVRYDGIEKTLFQFHGMLVPVTPFEDLCAVHWTTE